MAPQIALALLFGLMASLEVAHAQSADPSSSESFTPSARWSHYLRRTYGPSRSGLLAVETAFDQMLGQPGVGTCRLARMRNAMQEHSVGD